MKPPKNFVPPCGLRSVFNALIGIVAVLVVATHGPRAWGQVDIDLANDEETFEFRGGAVNDHLGGDSAQSVTTLVVDDFNDDGIDDFAIATEDAGSYGNVVLRFGATSSSQKIYNIANVRDVRISGELGNDIGLCIASGDVDGDGIADLVIGADQADNGAAANTGAGYVFYGRATWSPDDLVLSDADVVIYGWAANSRLGGSVACGDFNDDGFDDLALGAPGWNGGDGRVALILGRMTASWPASIDLASTAADLDVSSAVSSARLGGCVWFSDVNGDDHADLFAGAQDQDLPSQGFSGHAGYVYGWEGGSSIDSVADFTIYGNSGTYGLGHRGVGGDFNGDGYGDVMVLATDAPTPRAILIEGSANGLTTSLGATEADISDMADAVIDFDGSTNSGGVPSAIGAGDWDADGIDDVVVGLSTASPGGALFAGAADFFFGRTAWDAAGTARDFTVTGGAASDYLGQNVCLGDANGDGYDDLVLNAPYAEESGRSQSGQVYFLAGTGYAPTSLSLSVSSGTVSLAISARSGRSVTVKSSTSLSGWSDVTSFNTGREDDLVDEPVGTDPARFYRVEE
jgi:hypothetical protein